MFDLIKELEKYIPFGQKENKDVKKTLEFLKTNQNCYDRCNLFGHVTAGAFVCDGSGHILLNHHKKSGLWFQFGGHSDGESDCLKVAKREIMEEAGITEFKLGKNSIFDVAVMKIPFNVKRSEPEHLHYDINFLFIVNNYKFEISNESLEIKWVTIDEALRLINKNDYGMKRMIYKYKRWLNNTIKEFYI